MEKVVKPFALYIGVFATDPKAANKTVKSICKQALLQTLKSIMPENYIQEEQKALKIYQKHELQSQLTQKQKSCIESDYANFQNFNSPKDNYHITCLFMGKNKDKLCKQDKNILSNWKNGVKLPVKVDFIVYVPNYLITGFISSPGNVQVSNKFPHMTLLLKEKASAVESGAVLETLYEKAPQIFGKRQQRVTVLNVPYGTVSKIMIVIDLAFEFEGITGDNTSCGKK